jgi:hypothetical protein
LQNWYIINQDEVLKKKNIPSATNSCIQKNKNIKEKLIRADLKPMAKNNTYSTPYVEDLEAILTSLYNDGSHKTTNIAAKCNTLTTDEGH